MHHHVEKARGHREWLTVPAEIEIGGKQYLGDAVWLEPTQVHVRLQAMLPCHVDCCVVIEEAEGRLALPARVSHVETLTDGPGGPALVHHFTVAVPPSLRSGFARLLRHVNPRSTPLQRIWEVTPPDPAPVTDRSLAGVQRSRKRRTKSRAPSCAPKGMPRSVTEAPPHRRDRRRRHRTVKGLRTEELVHTVRKPGTVNEVIVRFDSVDVWRRSARLGRD